MLTNLKNTTVATELERSVFIPAPNKGNAKKCSDYHTIALIAHASKVMFKILQARLQHYVNQELPHVQVGFRKGRGTRDQIATIHWKSKKQENPRKTSTSVSLTMPKSLCGSKQTMKNSERDGNTRPAYLPPMKPVCRSKSNS